MVGGRQHILWEFFEKLLAALAVGTNGSWGLVAVHSLVSRRPGLTASYEVYREICLLLACLAGSYLSPKWSLWALIGAVAISLLKFARPTPADWAPASLRNVFAFLVWGLAGTTYLRSLNQAEIALLLVAAASAAAIHFPFAGRMGEPGFLIPGTFMLLCGAAFRSPIATGVGVGFVLPSVAVTVRNLKGTWALRGIAASVGAYLGRQLAEPAALLGFVLLFLMSLETWRFTLRLVVLALLKLLYRFRIYGESNMPYEGPAVLVGNHVSLLDGWLIAAHTQRFARFLVYDAYFKNPLMAFGLNLFRTIPISQGAKREAVESLREARRRIEEGHVAGIFPEGSVTRSGFLNPFQKGITRVAHGAALRIVPAYMNGLWTNLASFSEGAFHLRLPRLFRDLEIEYGEAISSDASHVELWNHVKALEVRAAFRDSSRADVLPLALLKAARKNSRQVAVYANGESVTYRQIATEALLWAEFLSKRWGKKRQVAVLLPDGPDRVVAYFALALAGQIAMEVPPEIPVGEFLERHRIGHVLTSREELAKRGTELKEGMILVSRLKGSHSRWKRKRMTLRWALSSRLAWRRAKALRIQKDSAVLAVPSANGFVLLSNRGVQAAAHAVRRVLWLKPGIVVRSETTWSSSAAMLLGLWTPLLHGAAIRFGEGEADFRIHPGEIVGKDGNFSFLEIPELSGIGALTAPPVEVAGEVQGGAKAGQVGRLLFGVEARQREGKIQYRSPQRYLRALADSGQAYEVKPGEWFTGPTVELDDFGVILEPRTS